MGYSKLTYDEFTSKPDYWIAQLGLILPAFADQVVEYGGRPVSAIDFYDSIFELDLEEQRVPEDYRTGEYGAIALEIIEEPKRQGRRTTVTQGNFELYDLIDRSENFCMMSPISYAGKHRTIENARFLYALTIEIDNIDPKNGINELFYSWRRKVATLPRPTYVVCSGSGVHLYYVFERAVPLYSNIYKQLAEVKKYFTPRLWNEYVTTAKSTKDIQWESLNQPFRLVGTKGKSNCYAMAFEVGEKITLEYLNEFLPEELKVSCIYKSKTSLEEAKKLWPDWYRRRIENGDKTKGHWNRHEGIYHNWKEKILTGAVVGKRYNCLENLCSLAVQCEIDPEIVEQDCYEIAEHFETMTNSDDNHFTEYDVICALRTYYQPSQKAFERRIEYIGQKTGIPLTPNKRNGRKQVEHLGRARAVQKFDDPEGNWRNKEGASKKADIVKQWREQNPGGRKVDCIKETGLSKPTVYKWWNGEEAYLKLKEMEKKTSFEIIEETAGEESVEFENDMQQTAAEMLAAQLLMLPEEERKKILLQLYKEELSEKNNRLG